MRGGAGYLRAGPPQAGLLPAGLLLAGLILAGLWVAGCVVQVGPPNPQPTPTPTTFAVRIINRTGKPLDPQVYVGRVANGRDLLFASVNKRTDFGVGAQGILLANAQVQFDITCGEPVYVGTLGGIYGDNLNAPAGQGQMVVLEEGASLHCGDLLTLTYAVSGGGLVTTYGVGPQ